MRAARRAGQPAVRRPQAVGRIHTVHIIYALCNPRGLLDRSNERKLVQVNRFPGKAPTTGLSLRSDYPLTPQERGGAGWLAWLDEVSGGPQPVWGIWTSTPHRRASLRCSRQIFGVRKGFMKYWGLRCRRDRAQSTRSTARPDPARPTVLWARKLECMTRACESEGAMKAAKSTKIARSKRTAKRTKSTSPAARRAKPVTRAQKSLADVTRHKTDMETRRARLSDEMRRGRAGAEIRLLALPAT
jgi:hypothetical protein